METAADVVRARPETAPTSRRSWMLLGLGVFVASISAIFNRYALEEATPLAISFWRCALGALALAPFAIPRLRALSLRDLVMPSIAGVFLAVHFATWISSIELTSIAVSVLLVSASPVFVAAARWLLFRDRLSSIGWTGILIALAGTALVGGTDFSGSSLEGNALALTGGVMVAGYILAGERSRRTLGILEFAVVTYSVAAIVLLVACWVSGTDLVGYGGQTWGWIAVIVVGPQLLGHTVINFVLKEIDATTVSVAIMAEPVIAASFAFVLFSETPHALAYPGGALILGGIYLVTVTTRRAD